MSKRKFRGVALAVSLLTLGTLGVSGLTSCQPETVVESTLELTGETSVTVGSSITLTCNESGVTWTSSNSSVAEVSTSGVVTGKRAGVVTITVQKEGFSNGTLEITVTPAEEENGTVDVSEVNITNKADFAADAEFSNTGGPKALRLDFGDTSINVNQALHDNAIEVTSADDSIATAVGLNVYPLVPGTTTITVTVHTPNGDVTDSVEVTVIGMVYKDLFTYDEVYAAESGTEVAFVGTIIDEFLNYGLFVGEGEQAVFIYGGKIPEGLSVGDAVYVEGTTGAYHGAFQVSDSLVAAWNEEVEPVVDMGEITAASDLTDADQGRKLTLSGTVASHSVDPEYGEVNMSVVLANGDEVRVNCDNRYVSEETLAAYQALKDGDSITMTGHVSKDDDGFVVVNPKLVTE